MARTPHSVEREFRCTVRQSGYGPLACTFFAPDLPGCVVSGPTVEAATAAGRKAVENRFDIARSLGLNMPPSGTADRPKVQLRIRTDRSLHRALSETAAEAQVSLNELVIRLLLGAVRRLFLEIDDKTTSMVNCVTSHSAPRQRVIATPSLGSWPQRLPAELHEQL